SLAEGEPVLLESVAIAAAILAPMQSAAPAVLVHSTVVSAGQVMLGASSSTTAMVWSQVLLLPQASVAVQVRVMTLSCAQLPAATLSAEFAVRFGSQLSVAVALPSAATLVDSPQLIVTFAGQVIAGAVVSVIVMIWSQEVLLLPQASVAVQVRVRIVSWSQLPAAVLSLELTTG
ncbi:MAG: hypothetical protein QGF67_20705, partial [Lentisphaeria bacterium]|nr:hypothetical protein [Lentisphaeria bacterium]